MELEPLDYVLRAHETIREALAPIVDRARKECGVFSSNQMKETGGLDVFNLLKSFTW